MKPILNVLAGAAMLAVVGGLVWLYFVSVIYIVGFFGCSSRDCIEVWGHSTSASTAGIASVAPLGILICYKLGKSLLQKEAEPD